MNTVTLILHAHLKRYMKRESTDLTVPLEAGETVRDLLERLGIPLNEVFAFVVNGKGESPDYHPAPGDRLELLPAISGG